MSFPILHTERLTLRQLNSADANGLFRLRSNEDYCRFTRMKQYVSIEQVLDYIKRCDTGYMENNSVVWSITLKELDGHIGSICLWNYSPDIKRTEIGYDLLPEFRGKGYISEAINAVVSYAFDVMSFDVVFAGLVYANEKSVKTLERNGYVNKGLYTEAGENGEPIEMALYELRREE